jgi:hypothetical protein
MVGNSSVGTVQGVGSMPIRSFTADEIRCVQPRYRSVVCGDVAKKELSLLQFAAGGTNER